MLRSEMSASTPRQLSSVPIADMYSIRLNQYAAYAKWTKKREETAQSQLDHFLGLRLSVYSGLTFLVAMIAPECESTPIYQDSTAALLRYRATGSYSGTKSRDEELVPVTSRFPGSGSASGSAGSSSAPSCTTWYPRAQIASMTGTSSTSSSTSLPSLPLGDARARNYLSLQTSTTAHQTRFPTGTSTHGAPSKKRTKYAESDEETTEEGEVIYVPDSQPDEEGALRGFTKRRIAPVSRGNAHPSASVVYHGNQEGDPGCANPAFNGGEGQVENECRAL